jgi:antitoxin component YwqK of YwqJK toxin-antitoxin module
MKPLLILSLYLSFTISAIGQNPIDSGFTNRAEAKNIWVHGAKEGKWIEYVYGKGIVTSDTSKAIRYRLVIYKAGLANGMVRGYYKSGKLFAKLYYKKGKEEGVGKTYYESGVISEEVPFKKGKRNGIRKDYYDNGTLQEEVPYTKDKMNGMAKIYFIDGDISEEDPYKNDQLNGIAKVYSEEGGLKSEISFTNGKRNGIAKSYSTNKIVIQETPFIADKINGIVKKYYENGKLKSETRYTDDKISGAVKEYDGEGKLMGEPPEMDTAKEMAVRAFCVLESTNEPVDSVEILVYDVDDNSVVGTSVTNSTGYSKYVVVKKGKYYLNTKKEPYESMNMYIYYSMMGDGYAATLNFHMKNKPSGPLHDADGNILIIK